MKCFSVILLSNNGIMVRGFSSKNPQGLYIKLGARYFGSGQKNNIKPAVVYANSDTQNLKYLEILKIKWYLLVNKQNIR